MEDEVENLNSIGFLLFGPTLVQNSEKINFGTEVLRDYTPYHTNTVDKKVHFKLVHSVP